MFGIAKTLISSSIFTKHKKTRLKILNGLSQMNSCSPFTSRKFPPKTSQPPFNPSSSFARQLSTSTWPMNWLWSTKASLWGIKVYWYSFLIMRSQRKAFSRKQISQSNLYRNVTVYWPVNTKALWMCLTWRGLMQAWVKISRKNMK